ncbi:MAG: hypothetical protein L0H64_21640, partial [Pseudonocardia sp.]|nr:hypothetical protein [Pseudonocardia sp.]
MVIEDVVGRPARRYCTAAHRSAARQARRAAVALGQDRQLAATLPWLREPEVEPASTHQPEPTQPEPTQPAPARGEAEPERPVGRRAEGARDRAARRRAAAGRPTDPVPGARTPGLNAPMPRRRRALAVLGAAGILAGGYAVAALEPVPVSASPQSATGAETGAQWASRARVALTSVNKQLDSIAQVEAEWFALPEEQRAASPTAPVEALVERRQLLERRRAMLESQLNSFESLGDARAELQESEQYLVAVEEALAEAPAAPARTPEQAAALAALDEQRDLRLRQRDARREELAALEGGVQDAAARPVPDDAFATAEVGEEVREVIRGERGEPGTEEPPTQQPPAQQPLPPQPDLVGGRDEQEGTPRQDVATSAPPDPRGPGDETSQLPDEPRDVDARDRDRDSGQDHMPDRMGPGGGMGPQQMPPGQQGRGSSD